MNGCAARAFGRSQRKARVADALALVGLPAEVAEAKAAQLSGGQRQRVALARATIVPPEVLLCDEPTSALDVSLAATVLNLLGRIRRELGMAMLFVTHDLGAARVVADRIAVMYLGRIVEVGPARRDHREPDPPLHPGPARRGARTAAWSARPCRASRPARSTRRRDAPSIPAARSPSSPCAGNDPVAVNGRTSPGGVRPRRRATGAGEVSGGRR